MTSFRATLRDVHVTLDQPGGDRRRLSFYLFVFAAVGAGKTLKYAMLSL